jgi:hypothetical protein
VASAQERPLAELNDKGQQRSPKQGGGRFRLEPIFGCFCFPADDQLDEAMAMIMKTATSLALAAACVLTISALPAHAQYASPTVVTNGPQTDSGDVSPSWSARQNVIESQRYERLLQTNPGFRQARMRKECGPITDPQLHADCVASFNQGEANVGSSMPPRGYNSESGR